MLLEYPTLACPRCDARLPREHYNHAWAIRCEVCKNLVQARTFPALAAPERAAQLGRRVLSDSDASCFHHPDRQAETVCDACGKFLCGLCDIAYDDAHYCSGCIEEGKRKGKMSEVVDSVSTPSGLALPLIILVGFYPFIGLVATIVALYFAIRHWHEASVVRSYRIRNSVAIVIGLVALGVQLFAYLPMFGGLFFGSDPGGPGW